MDNNNICQILAEEVVEVGTEEIWHVAMDDGTFLKKFDCGEIDEEERADQELNLNDDDGQSNPQVDDEHQIYINEKGECATAIWSSSSRMEMKSISFDTE